MAASLLACGIDDNKSIVFQQSAVIVLICLLLEYRLFVGSSITYGML